MHYVFIYNPNAGRLRSDSYTAMVKEKLDHLPSPNTFELKPTTKRGDVEQYARAIAEQYGEDAIVAVVGGDGSLNEAANGLAGTSTPLLVLPAGRGNDFSRSLYTKDERHADRILDAMQLFTARDITEYIDVYEIDLIHTVANEVSYPDREDRFDRLERYCINIASIGFDSNSVIMADRLSRKLSFLGTNIYYLGALMASFKKMKYKFDFSMGETNLKNRAYSLAAVCNGRYYGSGFLPNPRGHLRDGRIEAVVSKPVHLGHVLTMANRYSKGEIDDIDLLEQFSGHEAVVETTEKDPLIITLDGEAFYCQRIEMKAVQNQLKIVIPRSFGVPDVLK